MSFSIDMVIDSHHAIDTGPISPPPQSKKPIATDGLLVYSVSSDLMHTATVVVLPEDHLTGRQVNHANFPTARHSPRFGSHGHRQ
jgi:hypothetical protein